jgi:hypothetical protein
MSVPKTPGNPGVKRRLELKWVPEAEVEALVHASDNFNVLLAITLAFGAGLVAAAVALGAGAVHPVVIYIILGACGGCSVFGGFMVWRERNTVQRVRGDLRQATESYYIPSPFEEFNLGTGINGSPTVTFGDTEAYFDGQTGPITGAQPDDENPKAI